MINSNKELDFSNKSLNEDQLKTLCSELKQNTTLNLLILTDNNIGDEGCKYLSEALQKNSTLQKLHLYRNSIGIKGSKYLGEALKMNETLQTLILSDNKIQPQGCEFLKKGLASNFNLSTLHLRDNEIGVEGCKILSELLKENYSLQNLSLSENNIENEGCKNLCKVLEVNLSLRELNLRKNNIGDEGGQNLLKMLNVNNLIQKIDLEDNTISESILNQINQKLERNRNKYIEITSSTDFEEITKNSTELRTLRCKDYDISIKEVITPFEKFQNLEILDLRNNNFDKNFVHVLSKFIKTNYSLKLLNLQGNNCIDEEGGNALLSSLSFNLTLVHLNLRGTSIPSPIQKNIQSLIKVNNLNPILESLDVNTFRLFVEENIKELSKINDLKMKEKLMIFSCLMNRIEICNFLLKEGTINLNFQSTQEGNSFLHYSCMKNNFEISKLLIMNGINMSTKNAESLLAKDYSFGKLRNFIEEIEKVGSFDINIEQAIQALIKVKINGQSANDLFQFIPENITKSITELEKLINHMNNFGLLKELKTRIDSLFGLETNLNKLQEKIKLIGSNEELKKKSDLLDQRNKSRCQFVDKVQDFKKWMDQNLNLKKIKQEFKTSISILSKELEKLEEERRGNKIFEEEQEDQEGEIEYFYTEDLIKKTKNTLSLWSNWKLSIENYNRKLKEGIETISEAISKELMSLLDIFNKNELIKQPMSISKINLGKKIILLQTSIKEITSSDELEYLKKEIPTEEITKNIFKVNERYKVDIEEIESHVEKDIDKLINRMQLESKWYDTTKPEKLLNQFNQINEEWEELNLKLNTLPHEIEFLKKRKGREQELEIKEKELKEIKIKVKNLTKAKEDLTIKLSELCIHIFPELKIEYPQLNLQIFFESDGLEKYRKLRDYSDLVLLSSDTISRNKIYKAKWDNEICVLKCFELHNQNSLKSFRTETKTLNKLKHPNICKIECYFIEEDKESGINRGFIQMPYYEGGQLDNWILLNQPKENEWKLLLKEILRGLEYLHENEVIHCDIKPQNILITKEGIPKISDFDISKDLETRKQTILSTDTSTTFGGTMNYMSPEVFAKKGVYKESDIYSFGLILFDIYFPNGNRPEVNLLVNRKKPLEIPNHENKDLIDLLTNLLKLNPKERFTAKQALHHPFFIELWKFNLNFIQSDFGWENNRRYSKLFNLSNQDTLSSNNDDFLKICSMELKRLENIFSKQMDGTSKFTISRAYAIQNQNLEQGFSSRLNQMQIRLEEDSNLFKNETWRNENDINTLNWREWIMNQLTSFTNRFYSNKTSLLKIVPVFHAMKKEETSKKICENGFSALSLLDEGWFGKGIYFTSNLEYATTYYGAKNKNGEYTVLLTFVILGNVYPVIENPNIPNESLKGKPFKGGYDAHFTLVKPGTCLPCPLNDKGSSMNFTEFVIFQEHQCLPKYLLFVKPK